MNLSYQVSDIVATVEEQMTGLYQNNHHVDRSFELFRTFFLKHRNDPSMRDELAVHLYAFLANWGMLRNSFLMRKDYLFLLPVIESLCGEKYDKLAKSDFLPENKDLWVEEMLDLRNNIKSRCENVSVSETMVTKIMLATFGCVPAYDNYLRAGLKVYGICQTFNRKSLCQIADFATENMADILSEQEKIARKRQHTYPIMRILDSYFWGCGKKALQDKQKK